MKPASSARGLFFPEHHRQQPQRRENAVPGGGVVQEDQVAGLLAPQDYSPL